jgi:hypothetical protein
MFAIHSGPLTILRFQITMGEIKTVTSFQSLHDVASNLPYLSLRESRLLIDMPYLNIRGQIRLAIFHENAIFIKFDVRLIPKIENFYHETRIGHANSLYDF